MPLDALRANMVLPSVAADGANALARGDRYGDAFVVPLTAGLNGLAAERSYFRACNATPGTALTQAVTATFASTTPLISIRNTDAPGGKTIYLDYVYLFNTVIPASSTAVDLVITTDPNARAPTAGTALNVRNVNTDGPNTSIATMTFGPTATAAAVAERIVTRRRLYNAVIVVNTGILLNFGAQDSGNGQTLNGATALNLAVPVGPLAVGPGHTGQIHLYYAGNATTGASWEVEMGWFER